MRQTGEAVIRDTGDHRRKPSLPITAGQYLAVKHAGKEVKARLNRPRLKELNRRIKDFMGAELCRLAEKCHGKNATAESLNIVINAGPDDVAQLVKRDPKMACISMAEPPGLMPDRTTILDDGLAKLRYAAAAAGIDRPDPAALLARIELVTLRNSVLTAGALASILKLAGHSEHPVPDRIMREWLPQTDEPPRRISQAPTPQMEKNRLTAFIEACRLRRQQPEKYSTQVLTQALQRFRFNLLATRMDPRPAEIRLMDDIQSSITRQQKMKAVRLEQPGRPKDTGDEEIRERIALLWSDSQSRQQAKRAAASRSVWIRDGAVTVTAGAAGPTLYEVKRDEAGRISIAPDPGHDVLISAAGTIRHGRRPMMPGMNAAAVAAALSLAPDLPPDPESERLVQAATAVRYLAASQDDPQLEQLETGISGQATCAVNRLIDRETVARALRASGQTDHPEAVITIPQYNAAQLAGDSLDRLAETNPGAAAWLILCHPGKVTEPVKHPGQLVTIARRNCVKKRRIPPPRLWKTLAATRPEVLLQAARTPDRPDEPGLNRRTALAAVSAAAAAGARALTPEMAAVCRALQTTDDLQPETDAALLEYCFKSPQAALELGDELAELRDYCRANRPTAATFNGLVKANRRWHRRIQEIQRMAGLKNRKFLQWESALDETALDNGIVATPLTDTIMLGWESRLLNHCVFQYDEQCARGKTRIFHLSTGATAELRLRKDGWKPAQVRRSWNHQALDSEHEAAGELAERYAQAAQEQEREARRRRGMAI